MNRIPNSYHVGNQVVAQRATAKTLPALFPRDFSIALGCQAVYDVFAPIPSGIVLGMIILAAIGTGATLVGRARVELQASSVQYGRTASEVEMLRRDNAILEKKIARMMSEPDTIESIARARLGMVRPNDIVVPVEHPQSASNLETLSLVR